MLKENSKFLNPLEVLCKPSDLCSCILSNGSNIYFSTSSPSSHSSEIFSSLNYMLVYNGSSFGLSTVFYNYVTFFIIVVEYT